MSWVLILIIIYPFVVLQSIPKWTLLNFLLYLCSSLTWIICLQSIYHHSIKSWNIFGLFYFFSLWVNCFQLSDFQVEKTLFDFFAMFLGPLLFLLLLFSVEKIKVAPFNVKINLINLNFVYFVGVVSYCLICLHIGKTAGWRILAIQEEHRIISGNEFVVPYFSALRSILSWILVILAPYAKKRYAIIALAAIVVFSVILQVKRGDLIRILLFGGIYFIYQAKGMHNKKVKYGILGLVALTIIIFVLFGQWRIAQSGNNWQTINQITGIKFNSAFLAWLFGYLIIQFDVFSLSSSFLFFPNYKMEELWKLVAPSYSAQEWIVPINGFNAGTAFWGFVRDYGGFFIIEMFIFGFIINGLILLSKKTDCKGAYCFVCMLCALLVTGNYFTNRTIIAAIIFSNIIFLFTKNNKKEN